MFGVEQLRRLGILAYEWRPNAGDVLDALRTGCLRRGGILVSVLVEDDREDEVRTTLESNRGAVPSRRRKSILAPPLRARLARPDVEPGLAPCG